MKPLLVAVVYCWVWVGPSVQIEQPKPKKGDWIIVAGESEIWDSFMDSLKAQSLTGDGDGEYPSEPNSEDIYHEYVGYIVSDDQPAEAARLRHCHGHIAAEDQR